jgi:hypothetical protein
MAVYLDEDFIGQDGTELVFPNLLLCMGIGCQMRDGTLLGCHVSGSSTEEAVLAELKSRIDARPDRPRWLYMIADFEQHFLDRKLSFTEKARALGFNGDVFVLDTRPIVGDKGAHARLEANGDNRPCSVSVLKDEDARPYGNGPTSRLPNGSTVAKYSTFRQELVPPALVKLTDSAPRPSGAVPDTDLKIVRCN